jgi:hypothetical protein
MFSLIANKTFFGPKTCVAETAQALKIDQLGQIFMLSISKRLVA